MREVNKNIINVVVSGKFTDINDRNINYRVLVSLPNCIDEWLLSNITNRYLLEALKNCKEYKEDGTLMDNEDYGRVASIKSVRIEYTDKTGKSLLMDTGKIPSFYGKSVFDCSYMELQDIATAFGLHEIKVDDTMEELQKNTIIAYLTRIKKIPESKLKEMSFYRYDKKRMKYYIEFDETDRRHAIINKYQCADLEEFEEEERILNGFRHMTELFDEPDQPDTNLNEDMNFKSKPEIRNNKKVTTI